MGVSKLPWRAAQDVHPQLWKGANRKFDKVPWRRIEAERHNAERTPEQQVRWRCLSPGLCGIFLITLYLLKTTLIRSCFLTHGHAIALRSGYRLHDDYWDHRSEERGLPHRCRKRGW